VNDITHVINFDLPRQPEDYIHRIGRTGRADRKGKAISLITDKEKFMVQKIERYASVKIEIIKSPHSTSKATLIHEKKESGFKSKRRSAGRSSNNSSGKSFAQRKPSTRADFTKRNPEASFDSAKRKPEASVDSTKRNPKASVGFAKRKPSANANFAKKRIARNTTRPTEKKNKPHGRSSQMMAA